MNDTSVIRSVRNRAVALLAEPGCPRVFAPTELQQWLKSAGESMSTPAVSVALKEWDQGGLVSKIRHGIYLNKRASPAPTLDEAAPLIRAGAVISLQRVLGQAGVLNNPTSWITSVIPMGGAHWVGTVKQGENVFTFSGLHPSLIPASDADWAGDAYQAYAQVPTATPEKALTDWLYLAKNSPKWRLPPAHDLDLDALDPARMTRLTERMGVADAWAQLQIEAGLAVVAQEQSVGTQSRQRRRAP
jgi:hypothetical protein